MEVIEKVKAVTYEWERLNVNKLLWLSQSEG